MSSFPKLVLVTATVLALGCSRPVNKPQVAEPQAEAVATESAELLAGKAALASGDIAAARTAIQQHLIANPQDAAGLAVLVEIMIQEGEDFADFDFSIPATGDNESLALLSRKLAGPLYQLGRFKEANQSLQQASRSDALGEPELLLMLSQTIPLEVFSGQAARQLDKPTLLHRARVAFAQKRFTETIQMLQESGRQDAEAKALLVRAIASQQRFAELADPLAELSQATSISDYWATLGTLKSHEGEVNQAIGAWLRCLQQDPTDEEAYTQLFHLLSKIDRQQESQAARARASSLRNTRQIARRCLANPQEPKYRFEMSDELLKLGRPLESLAWKELGLELADAPQSAFRQVSEQRSTLNSAADFETAIEDFVLLALQPDDFPVETKAGSAMNVANQPMRIEPADTELAFVDVAAQVGVQTEYFNNVPKQLERIRLHQTLGGGVAVLDYDRDGRPDLYISQGGYPLRPDNAWKNHLFRNHGQAFQEVSQSSQSDDHRYSVGVTAGDINQDGFSDLFVGNVGSNLVLINNGDGTFSNPLGEADPKDFVVTTSVAIADVTGDHLPDLIETNYVNDERIFAPLQAKPGSGMYGVSPLDYQLAADRVLVNLGDGTFEAIVLDKEDDLGSSLGLIVTDLDGQVGNEVFIANDMTANHFWKRTDEGEFVESARVRGLSVAHDGTIGACMGVAASDFDRNGQIDLHVTNFYQQSSNLFLQTAAGLFVDFAPRYQIVESSYWLLGFGTQAVDLNRDGWNDIVVLNGHIEDYSQFGDPFRMLPQLLLHGGDRFFEAELSKDSSYFQTPALGRALATLDWNRDGRVDLVATHLDAPLALLENRSPLGNWLAILLVGVESERDAIGATVRVQNGSESWVGVVASGDGYLVKNEAVVWFGLGKANSIQGIEIRWPSGRLQTFPPPSINQRYLAIEQQPDLTPVK